MKMPLPKGVQRGLRWNSIRQLIIREILRLKCAERGIKCKLRTTTATECVMTKMQEEASKIELTAVRLEHGDQIVRTAAEIGWVKASEIVARAKSAHAEPVRQVLLNCTDANAVFAQKMVWASHVKGQLVARTQAVTATGFTSAGDALAATYSAEYLAAIERQPDSVRLATTSVFVKRGEATDIFGYSGNLHFSERLSFKLAHFQQVRPHQVAGSVLRSVEQWMRGASIVWVKLPSPEAARVAQQIWDSIEEMGELEELIAAATIARKPIEPALVSRYHKLKLGVEAFGLFFGYEHGSEYRAD
jgi:hypothetical protein